MRLAICSAIFSPRLATATFSSGLRRPESIARSAIVEWLTNPTEWECAPDDIELMSIIGNDVFVYRFRVEGSRPWAAGFPDVLLQRFPSCRFSHC